MNRRFTALPLLFGALLTSAVALAGQPVDVNNASAEQLAQSLDGIGLNKARAIVQYRSQHGPFQHPDELVNVKGIGLATVDKNRANIQLSKKKVAGGE